MTEIFALRLFSIVPPLNLFNMDAPSTGGSAQWVGVAGCSGWLQSEASLENNLTEIGPVQWETTPQVVQTVFKLI